MIYRNPLISEDFISNDIMWNIIRIDTKSFNLSVDVFLDESNIAASNNLPEFILFRNSYDSNSRNYMPMTISDNIVLLSDKKLNIYRRDLYKIHEWMTKYRNFISAISKCELYATDFLEHFSLLSKKINENLNAISKYSLVEMAKLYPKDSGLRYQLWLDDDQLYQKGGHSYRIKVEPPLDTSRDSKSWNTLTSDMQWIGKSVKRYRPKDRKLIEDFFQKNFKLILNLADKIITIEEFKSKFKKIDDIDEDEELEEDYKFVFHFDDEYDMVINDYSQYNVIDVFGNLLSDEWFSYIEYGKYITKTGETYFKCIGLNSKKYYLYTDKRLIEVK